MTVERGRAFVSGEVCLFWRYIRSSLDRLIEVVTNLDPDGRHWHPPAANSNSVLALAVHTLANAEENLLGTLLGGQVERDRASEFIPDPDRDDALIREWSSHLDAIAIALAAVSDADLNVNHLHPRRGEISGRDVLIVVARHVAEHLGQAELTRDLAIAARG